MHARLDPEHGAIVQSAIETIARAERLDHAAALVRMAEIALAAVADTESRCEGCVGTNGPPSLSTSPPPSCRPPRSRPAEWCNCARVSLRGGGLPVAL
jgi:hypothetical protein